MKDAALVIEHDFNGDKLEMCVPFVISPRMDKPSVCSDLTRPSPITPVSATVQPTVTKAGNSGVQNAFGAFITSYLPNDAALRKERASVFRRQLNWWLKETNVSISVVLSNWSDTEVDSFEVLSELKARQGQILRVEPQVQILNRIECLRMLYYSEYDWGIMLDDDAILYDKQHHNSGSKIFAEMAANGIASYQGVDVFFPINPQKTGFNPIWNKNPAFYNENHVFQRNLDLKGSMFCVRNFVKEGRPPVYPPIDHRGYGEDTLFAIEAVSKGCSVMQCQNIVLNEISQGSHYAKKAEDRKPKMKAAHEAIAKRYAHLGLQMKKGSHLLDKKSFIANCGKGTVPKIGVKKP